MMLSLTRDQREALTKIKEFLNSKTHDCFVLGGYAGTGKTTLLGQVIEYLKATGISFSLMAPTGKAAFNLRKITGEKAFTVHRVIYDFDKLDLETFDNSYPDQDEDFAVKFYYRVRLGECKVYIVDEASMISDYYSGNDFLQFGSGKVLSDLIHHIGFDSNGRLKGKIIFCGDIGQLPPVNMNFSPAMSVEYLSKKFNLKVDFCFLKEVLRGAKVREIQKTVENIRKCIEGGKFNYFRIAPSEEIIHLNEDSFRNVIMELFKEGSIPVIISYTNDKVAKYNRIVKSLIGLDPYKIEQGDRLLIYRNNYFYHIEFYNGQELEVVEQLNNDEEFEFGENKISYSDVKVRTFNYENGEFIETNVKILKNFIFSYETEDDQKLWKNMFRVAVDKDSKLQQEYKKYNAIKRKLKKHKYDASLKNELREVSQELGELIRKNVYLNPIMAKFGYAVTCHKAQGSEWDNVIIDLDTSGLNPVSELFFRWAYTAITRSKKRVYILNNFVVTPLFKVEVKKEIIKPGQLPPEEERFYRGEEELDYENEIIEGLEPEFVRTKYSRIVKLFSKIGVIVEVLDNSKWRLRLRFFNDKDETVVDLPYSKKGFTGAYKLIDTSSEDFSKEVIYNLENLNYAKENVSMPKENWKRDVFTLIKGLCEKFEIKITNFIEKQNCDRYYLITESEVAWVDLFYNNKGLYSTVVGYSLLGDEDKKLISLLKGIENSKEIIPWDE